MRSQEDIIDGGNSTTKTMRRAKFWQELGIHYLDVVEPAVEWAERGLPPNDWRRKKAR